jgi:hypothetical protein
MEIAHSMSALSLSIYLRTSYCLQSTRIWNRLWFIVTLLCSDKEFEFFGRPAVPRTAGLGHITCALPDLSFISTLLVKSAITEMQRQLMTRRQFQSHLKHRHLMSGA